jgi:NDP-sugar pyrophosphorylase family protein
MNGDVLILEDLSAMLATATRQGTELTLALTKHITLYAFRDIDFDGDFVTRIEDAPDIATFILAGVHIVTPDIVAHVPARTYFRMGNLFKELLATGCQVARHELEEYWLDIGQIHDYEQPQQVYNTHFQTEGP